MKLAHTFVGVCALLGGCDASGVSLGTEELCQKDPRLVAAEERAKVEPISNCAVIGENVLVNAGFEVPIAACGEVGLFCQLPVDEVTGWSTSSSDQVIELWQSGHTGVVSPEGNQFGELNARSRDTLWQEVVLSPGQLMYWSLQHRGRDGIDSMELQIGPPDALKIVDTISSAEDDWHPSSGFYRVGEDEPRTRFALVSRNALDHGNLVDAVVFAPVD
jgi:hypothetical protein